MKENKVKREKGTVLIVATALLTEGVQAINTDKYISGIICIIAAIVLFYIREHYKFRRWSK